MLKCLEKNYLCNCICLGPKLEWEAPKGLAFGSLWSSVDQAIFTIKFSAAYDCATQANMLRASLRSSRVLGYGLIATRAGRQWQAVESSFPIPGVRVRKISAIGFSDEC